MLTPISTGGGTISIGCSDDNNNATMFRNKLAAIQVGSLASAALHGAVLHLTAHKGNNPAK
jgi:hypothetical protein